ncbi:hypothetical protein GCM10022383_09820 [Microbacterium soli]|uniref:Tail specific protease domain-containing protein n=1 Tax=Microbacterium soli TaxID=446075 RepID=A0ABP7MZQ4_9MICO
MLGRRVFRPASDTESAWVIEAPTEADTAPQLQWRSTTRLASIATSESDFLATMNALHTLLRTQRDAHIVAPVASVEEAIHVIYDEIANTYPYFALRGLDWDLISRRHMGCEPSPTTFPDMAAAWVAELGDAHTGIRTSASGGFNPDYRGNLRTDGVHLTNVPSQSAAWEAGVRPGWIVEIEDVEHLMSTVGATPQQLPEVQARRAMAIRGTHRVYRAHDPSGTRAAEWDETAAPTTLDDSVKVEREQDGGLRIRLRAFASRLDLHSVFDDVIASAAPSAQITVDLRGNTGGSILLATDLRDRFLTERTKIGYVAFTDGRGGIAPRTERWAELSDRRRWEGRTEIFIDSMTYSASEDFVLGLQGLEHVRVSGSVSGDGSGRPRRVPLLPGVDLTISTAITYDRCGSPVEFRGIHPDTI